MKAESKLVENLLFEGSWIGVLHAKSGTLLGGVRVHDSSRFSSKEDAQAWLDQAVRANKEAGRDVGHAGIVSSNRPPEIGPGGSSS
jgi:hypothetical protein